MHWKWRRLELIDKKHDDGLDEDEKRELQRLNERLDDEISEKYHNEDDRLQELYDKFDKGNRPDHALARLGRGVSRLIHRFKSLLQ